MTTSNATVKTVSKIDAQATEMQTKLVQNLEIRLDLHEEKSGKICTTLRADIAKFKTDNGFAVIKACLKKGLKLDDFIATVAIADTDDNDKYLAVKAITKCRQFMQAVAQGSASKLDGYTDSIMRNLLVHKALTVFECEQCLSGTMINEHTNKMRIDETKKIVAYKNSGASTATTQASSSRMMLKMFNICAVEKGRKDDVISFTDEKTALLMLDLYKLENNA
ncbi:hypothetical protein [Acinetobacter brisouii]|uniref:hypothetical protein n=1 Tax=Acinetobacter brisouii TaxID=396323 RepID=UPI00124D4B56|nr:hypothetical protein [Acinetobacter brisouii]